MATIERLTLENMAPGANRWDEVAAAADAWVRAAGIEWRDAIVLLPFAQLLPPARHAFARAGGWQPRIESTKTLAASLGPAASSSSGEITFDTAVDVLNAAALLRGQSWGAAWARRDPRGFEQAAAALTATAQTLATAAFALPPTVRAAHWSAARELLTPLAGPGSTERLLARIALEWACLASAPVTDRLFAMTPPAAWIAVQAGGLDALTASLLNESPAPGLVIDTDVIGDDPFAGIALHCAPAFALCDDFEHEAQCAAAQVLAHVQRGELPVALIAQDRVLVRRVRALLERQQVVLLDETGWKLSTTRAAARVMTLLVAVRADAGTDALLDWLKTGTTWTRADEGAALTELEAICRRRRISRVAALAHTALAPAAAGLWSMAAEVLAGLAWESRQPLGAWLAALAKALDRCGAMTALQSDDAGRQLLIALRLTQGTQSAGTWTLGASRVVMGFDAFKDWVDRVLEQANFMPPAPANDAQVVITPLARAMLRPFAAVVFPGADDRRLGAAPAIDPLLGDALAGELGLPTLAQRRQAELLAFVQLLAAPRLTLLRRRVDGSDPLAASPLAERLALELAQRHSAFVAWHDPRIDARLTPTPIRMSAPSAASLLPALLSASASEALRACPYRFFALSMLRLREDDELEREIEKRDYGTWLHAVLYDFHASRGEPGAAAIEIARLMQLADARRVEQGILDADFLPFAASFASFAPRYIAWLHRRDGLGARWQRGEVDLRVMPPSFNGIEMRGVIDRIDDVRIAGMPAVQMIDYKTGGVAGLKDKVREPLEDTQLAFYAALMRAQTEAPLAAIYLAVDGTKGLAEVPHPDVQHSAAALVEGLAADLKRLRAGAGLPALGEGVTCDFCAARGVCRRDHWAEAVGPDPVWGSANAHVRPGAP